MNKGFTLIELMVTVIIIGILSSIALPQYTKAVNKAKLAEAVTNMGNLQRGIDMYCTQFKSECQASSGVCFTCSNGPRLDIDLKGAIPYGGGGASATKNFSYYASCSSSNCQINISCNGSCELPTLTATRATSGLTSSWTKTCTGKAVYCSGLEAQGYSVSTTAS